MVASPRCVSPAVAFTSKIPSSMVSRETSIARSLIHKRGTRRNGLACIIDQKVAFKFRSQIIDMSKSPSVRTSPIWLKI